MVSDGVVKVLLEASTGPPVALAYQLMVPPVEAVAFSTTVPVPQLKLSVLDAIVGATQVVVKLVMGDQRLVSPAPHIALTANS